MKLLLKKLNTLFKFEEGKINLLILEDAQLFLSTIEDLYAQCNGECAHYILSEEETEISFSKSIEMITDYINLDLNDKRIMSKIMATLSKNAQDAEYYLLTNDIMAKVEKYLDNLEQSVSFPLTYKQMDISALLKSVSVKCEKIYDTMSEKIIYYMKVCSEFCKTKLFILINLKLFLKKEELIALYRDIVYNKFNVLLIETIEMKNIPDLENVMIIDQSFCEIIY